jgi:hypothetical protein
MALGLGTNARLIAAFEATYGRFRVSRSAHVGK